MKKIYLALCMIITIVAMTACGAGKTTTTTIFDESEVISQAQTIFENWTTSDFSSVDTPEGYQAYVDSQGEDTAAQVKIWEDTKVEIGASGDGVDVSAVTYEIIDTDVTYNEDTAVATITAKFPKETLLFKVILGKDLSLSSVSLDIYKTLGQKVVKALLNTVMGMSIVFIVLIFISLIIGLLKYVPMLLERKSKKAEVSVPDETPAVEDPVVEEEELVDDTELVAVITAAIMASMGEKVPADGLVIRSIRRANKKWKNA